MNQDPEIATLAFQKLHPRAYYDRFLKLGIRPDGRKTGQVRRVSVSQGTISTADGSAIVTLGATQIVCGIRYLVSTPNTFTQEKGRVDVKVHLSGFCSAKYEESSGPAKESFILANSLSRIINNSEILDQETLCIEEEKAVYVLCADLVCVNDDGGLFDCCLTALVAALIDIKLPTDIKFDRELGETIQLGETCDKTLGFKQIPVALTFGIFKDYIVSDPVQEELDILDGQYTVATTNTGQICHIAKSNGPTVSQEYLFGSVAKCMENMQTILSILNWQKE